MALKMHWLLSVATIPIVVVTICAGLIVAANVGIDIVIPRWIQARF